MFKYWWLWCLLALLFFGIGAAVWTYGFLLYAGGILSTVGSGIYTIQLFTSRKWWDAFVWLLITIFLVWFLGKFFF